MSKGKGGRPQKIVLRTESGWVVEAAAKEKEIEKEIAQFTREAMAKVDAPDKVFEQAFNIIKTYRQQLTIFENPKANHDKNGNGIGRFGDTLKKRANKMADQLDEALRDEASNDLAELIDEGNLRFHLQKAYEHLLSSVVLLDRAKEGVEPLISQSQVRNAAGGKLKGLAREHKLPMMEFVRVFDVYPGHPHHTNDAFNKWFQRLK